MNPSESDKIPVAPYGRPQEDRSQPLLQVRHRITQSREIPHDEERATGRRRGKVDDSIEGVVVVVVVIVVVVFVVFAIVVVGVFGSVFGVVGVVVVAVFGGCSRCVVFVCGRRRFQGGRSGFRRRRRHRCRCSRCLGTLFLIELVVVVVVVVFVVVGVVVGRGDT